MKPARLLTASGISPVQVSVALDGLDLALVEIRPAPVRLTRLWGGAVGAMTLGTKVYVRPDLLDTDPAKLGPHLEEVCQRLWKLKQALRA
ncbi:MAG: hypothetical protein MUP13_05985 [Thermoanaerobaculales bacterium]|nr:hypothetical protein [Thermoanaerobaculales bacterium]